MRILCIDQATTSGYAFGIERSEEKYVFGSFKMPKRDAPGERLVIFRDTLVELIERHKPDLVAYEQIYLPVGEHNVKERGDGQKRIKFNVQTMGFLKNLEGVLIETTARYGLPTEHFPSSSWRVTALGYGRLPQGSQDDFKKLMKQRARSLGYAVTDDNEADAIGMLIHMLHGAPANLRAQGDLLGRVAGL